MVDVFPFMLLDSHWLQISRCLEGKMFFTQQEIYGEEERKFGYPMAWNENLVKGTQ